MTKNSLTAFRIIIIILGVLNIFIGLNIGFGGISTLGWQGQSNFFEVTNESVFLMRDSHMRYFGGLYFGIGIFMILATSNLKKYQSSLRLIFILIFIGGITRFSMMRFDIIFGSDIIGSVLVELLLMPILYFWLLKILNSNVLQSNN